MPENRPASEIEALLAGHQEVAMDAAYRASLLAATREVVVSRRSEARRRFLTWAAAAAALPAGVVASVVLFLALQTVLFNLPRALAQEYQAREAYQLAQIGESSGPESELLAPALREASQ